MADDGTVRFGREPWDASVATVAASGVGPEFSRHAHVRWVIGLVARGTRRLELCGQGLDIGPGGLFVIPAHTPHAWTPLGPPPHAHLAVCLSGEALPGLVREGGGPGAGPEAAVARLVRFFDLAAGEGTPGERRAALASALAAVTGLRWPSGGDGDAPRPGVERAAAYLARHAPDNPSLAEAARHAGVSPFHLHRLFTARFGLPPHAFVRRERLRLAIAALEDGAGLATAAALAGYADQSHFTRQFRGAVGVTPGRFVRSLGSPPGPGPREAPSG